MGQKNWWMKLDKAGWKNDPRLSMCATATRAIWLDLCITLEDLETDRMTGTVSQFARCCRCTEKEAADALQDLRITGTADVTEQDGQWSVICRRMTRDREISEVRRDAVQTRYKEPTKPEQKDIQNPSSNSISISSSELVEELREADIDRVYAAYPRKVGPMRAKQAIRKAVAHLKTGKDWPKLTANDAISLLHEKATRFARSPSGQAGEYTPHPATWFNAGRYLEEESEWEHAGNQKHTNRNASKGDSTLAALTAILSDRVSAGTSGEDGYQTGSSNRGSGIAGLLS